jgi:hypothetical protein
VTSRPGTGKSITFFYSVLSSSPHPAGSRCCWSRTSAEIQTTFPALACCVNGVPAKSDVHVAGDVVDASSLLFCWTSWLDTRVPTAIGFPAIGFPAVASVPAIVGVPSVACP